MVAKRMVTLTRIMDLGARLHQCTLLEFLEKLSQGNHRNFSLHRQHLPTEKPENKLEVISVSALTSADLVHYLNSRGFHTETTKYCKGVETNDGKKLIIQVLERKMTGSLQLTGPRAMSRYKKKQHRLSMGITKPTSAFQDAHELKEGQSNQIMINLPPKK